MRVTIFKIDVFFSVRWFAMACMLVLLVGCGTRSSRIETDLMALFPGYGATPEVDQALDKVRQIADRQLVFLVRHPNLQQAMKAAAALSYKLEQDSRIQKVRSRLPEDQTLLWWEFYSPYADQLLTDEARTLLRNRKGETLVQKVLMQIYSPFAAVGVEELRSDPMLLTRSFLTKLRSINHRLDLNEGWLVAEDSSGNSYVMITAELAITPYALVEATRLAGQIDAIIAELTHRDHDCGVLRQGTLFFAAHGISQAKKEISTIGLGSVLGLLCLFVAVFRSLRPLLLSLASIACGLLAAALATTAIFGNIHIFTLVIGASLIGVSVDYSFHYLCDWQLDSGSWQPWKALRRILPAITMGLLTSCLAYLSLLLTPFRGLQQLAVFSSIGLLSSFLFVVLLYPVWISKASVWQPLTTDRLENWRSRLHAVSTNRMVWCVLLVFTCLALPFLTINDDVRQLQAMPDTLVEESQVIAEVTGQSGVQEMLLVEGKDADEVLGRLETVSADLNRAITNNSLDRYLNVATFVPSLSRQKEDFRLVKESLYRPYGGELAGRLKLEPEIVNSESLKFSPLTIEQWLASPVSLGWRNLWLGEIGQGVGALIPLSGIHNRATITAIAAQYKGVVFISRASEVSELFGRYRVRISSLLVISYFVIFIWMLKRYGIALAGRILAAPMMGGAVALAALAALGLPLNLFGVLGLVLVLGIGIDYTIFLAECRTTSGATSLAITLSCTTTLLSFGLLSLSETAAIHCFGLVVLVGIFTAYLLSAVAYRSGDKG